MYSKGHSAYMYIAWASSKLRPSLFILSMAKVKASSRGASHADGCPHAHAHRHRAHAGLCLASHTQVDRHNLWTYRARQTSSMSERLMEADVGLRGW